MRGLYRIAESIHREERLLHLIHHEEKLREEDFDISPREGEEILNRLDEVVGRKKINVNNNTFTFHAQKKDIILPVIINLIAIIAVAGGIFLFAYFSKTREASITSPSGELYSTEGRLLEKMKQESEAQLSKKDAEIAETMKKLDEVNDERNKLQLEMEQKIQDRENKLNEELKIILETEREKLLQSGATAENIDSQLQQMEIEKLKENREQLAAFAEEARQEAEQRQNTLNEVMAEYEDLLNKSRNEQAALQNELKLREDELNNQLQEQTETNAAAFSAISTDLELLRKSQQDQQFVDDHIQMFYKQIKTELGKEDFNEALNKLDSLKKYITDTSASGMLISQDRMDVEIFIIDSIANLIESKRSSNSSDTAGLAAEAAHLSEISGIIRTADELYQADDFDGASSLYLQAFDMFPLLGESYNKLKSINDRAVNKELQELSSRIQSTESELLSARRRINNYEEELNKLSERVKSQNDAETHRQILSEKISAAEKLYGSETASTATEGSNEKLLSLVQAKLTMKEILTSESVSEEHPELYDEVEDYFAAWGEEKKKEGVYSSLKDVITLIDALSDSGADTNLASDLPEAGSNLEKSYYSELLEKLNRLMF